MELVVDTNILISAIIKSKKSRSLLCSSSLLLYAPEDLIAEMFTHEEKICALSGITPNDLMQLAAFFLGKITLVPEELFKESEQEAISLVTHPEDIPFAALALHKKIGLWTDDKALRKQSMTKLVIWSTDSLLKASLKINCLISANRII